MEWTGHVPGIRHIYIYVYVFMCVYMYIYICKAVERRPQVNLDSRLIKLKDVDWIYVAPDRVSDLLF